MKVRLYRLWIAVIIFIVVIIMVQIRKNEIADDSKTRNSVQFLLPEFKTADWRGRTIDTEYIVNRNIYIHFLDNRYKYDIEYLNNVVNEWKDYEIEFIVFTEDPEIIKNKFPTILNRIIIVSNNINDISKKLSGTNNKSYCYLFDKNHKYVSRYLTELPYKDGIYNDLRKLILNKQFSAKELIGSKNILSSNILNKAMSSINPGNDNYKVLIFLSSICDSCIEGTIIPQMRMLHEKRNIDAAIVLYNSFNDFDIERLRRIYNISFPIIKAEDDLLDTWKKMINEYSTRAMAMIIIIASRNGDIIGEYYNGCNCMEDIQEKMKRIYEKGSI